MEVAPSPTGIGALICRGALMTGGPFLLLSLRFLFLRSEIPLPFSSDMLAAEKCVCTVASS